MNKRASVNGTKPAAVFITRQHWTLGVERRSAQDPHERYYFERVPVRPKWYVTMWRWSADRQRWYRDDRRSGRGYTLRDAIADFRTSVDHAAALDLALASGDA